jgi:hypothetical protein
MAESVAVWERASLVMHRLCDGFGIRYLHAVQPNQYFPGTKPMGAVERRRAIHPYHPYGRAARRGYPLLVKGIERLNAAGVPVADLTRLFAEIEDALYLDNCCHLTADGERRLALAVADALADVSRRNDGAGTGP